VVTLVLAAQATLEVLALPRDLMAELAHQVVVFTERAVAVVLLL
jgi:hypothetical protein